MRCVAAEARGVFRLPHTQIYLEQDMLRLALDFHYRYTPCRVVRFVPFCDPKYYPTDDATNTTAAQAKQLPSMLATRSLTLTSFEVTTWCLVWVLSRTTTMSMHGYHGPTRHHKVTAATESSTRQRACYVDSKKVGYTQVAAVLTCFVRIDLCNGQISSDQRPPYRATIIPTAARIRITPESDEFGNFGPAKPDTTSTAL